MELSTVKKLNPLESLAKKNNLKYFKIFPNEKSIGQRSEKITTIVIAHRLTTLKYCDQIFELKNCKISRTGSYDEIIGT